ncbi:hypothetical protein [Polaromonas sp. AER18D-145]|uniref:hypothetical protein n=1 Tax=Polaromonas sp. AER18D-145 TaxID=1977060 RepID=UPI00197B5505|nr:hypothetical protein [Polaromonas sp. AER18D-145]
MKNGPRRARLSLTSQAGSFFAGSDLTFLEGGSGRGFALGSGRSTLLLGGRLGGADTFFLGCARRDGLGGNSGAFRFATSLGSGFFRGRRLGHGLALGLFGVGFTHFGLGEGTHGQHLCENEAQGKQQFFHEKSPGWLMNDKFKYFMLPIFRT